jgi:glutaminase
MMAIDYEQILETIYDDVKPLLTKGQVADYIPELAHIAPDQFGMAVVTIQSDIFTIGAAETTFSIQSISKVFTLTMAMQLEGDALWQRVNREPSGTAFNSLVQLEYEQGIPRNPFINAGALVITDAILRYLPNAKQAVIDFLRTISSNPTIDFDPAVAQSEQATGFRNAAMANLLKSFGNLQHEPDQVLSAYFYHCSIAMNCIDLAKAGTYLANGGICPWNSARIIDLSQTKYINSLMLTCGTYDEVGNFAYRVGLPGKSGVGGGILAVMPGEFSVCVWSPRLNKRGNSYAGIRALELFTTLTGISIF